jgi:mannan endo-1,4-beta-mannosidase
MKNIASAMNRPTLFLLLVGVLCFAAGMGVLAQSSQLIYDDSLQNGWQDWSWSTRDLNNPAPVHSGAKSISVACGAWQAISLVHNPFSTAPYTKLVFWAHGGTNGGQLLRITAQRTSANLTNYASAGPLAAGAWQRVAVSLSSLGVAGVSDCTNFWIWNYSANPLPTFYLDDISLEANASSVTNPPSGSTISLEAENGTLTGTTVSTAAPGYSGTGYVTGFDATGDSVSWTFGGNAGLYRFWIRFRTPNGPKGFDATLNGTGMSATFPQTNAFSMFDAGLVELVSGANTLQIGGGWNWYEIDAVTLAPVAAPPPPAPVPATLTDAQATFAARALIASLVADYGKYTWAGQHETSALTFIQNTCGRQPVFVEGDLIDYSPSRVQYGGMPANYMENYITLDQTGYVLGFCWHWNAPTNLMNTTGHEWWRGFYTDSTTFDVVAALANTNSAEYALILRDIDAIAAQLKKVSSNNIPVLWRPLHEAAGGWFWWGAKGAEPFKALWRLLYNRLTAYRSLHNLIWVLTNEDPAWYPGDDVVDIVGVDAYPSDPGSSLSIQWEALKAQFDGVKLLTLSEFGGVPDTERMHQFGVWWSYFSPWSGTFISNAPPATINRIYQSSEVLTLDEINARPPVITMSGKGSGGAFQLSGTGPHGAAYRVLASTNLSLPASQWTQVSTGRFAGGVFTVSDTQATNHLDRFYRVAKP